MSEKIASHAEYRDFATPNVILLATDLEDDIDYLLTHAVAQARSCSSTLVLAHALPPTECLELNSRALLPADAFECEQEAKRKLTNIAGFIRRMGVSCKTLLREGFPADVIPAMVHETGATRVIVGTHGRRHLKKMLLGSVAYEILRNVDVPICTIGPHVSCKSPVGAPKRILHPVSLNKEYEHSARCALEIAQFYGADITLLHVLARDMQREADTDQIAAWTRAELERLIPDEAPLWITTSVEVERGAVAVQILDAADEMNADLIVLGVNPGFSFWPIREDNTAYEIILRAKCPVLTVRRPASARSAAEQYENGRAVPAGHC
jgi:nucleotide-binding universal stress UspA family protein